MRYGRAHQAIVVWASDYHRQQERAKETRSSSLFVLFTPADLVATATQDRAKGAGDAEKRLRHGFNRSMKRSVRVLPHHHGHQAAHIYKPQLSHPSHPSPPLAGKHTTAPSWLAETGKQAGRVLCWSLSFLLLAATTSSLPPPPPALPSSPPPASPHHNHVPLRPRL